MTILEVAQKVKDEKQCHLLRVRKGEPRCEYCGAPMIEDKVRQRLQCSGAHIEQNTQQKAPIQVDAKPYFTGSKRGWVALDLFTASAICAVAEGLNPVNRYKYERLTLPAIIRITWKVVK